MEGEVAREQHFFTELNNKHWNAKGEQDRNHGAYTEDVERRLLDPGTVSARGCAA